MEKRRVNRYAQPRAITCPEGWHGAERAFAQQVRDVVEDIYLKYGRLGMKDLAEDVRGEIQSAVKSSAFESVFTQTAKKLDVQFGVPGSVNNPTMEITKDRFVVRVKELIFELLDGAGNVKMELRADGSGGFQMIYAQVAYIGDISCDQLIVAGRPIQDGKSAYELAVAGGFVGTQAQWLASLSGGAGYVATEATYPTLQTTAKTIVGAINELKGAKA